jgi:hypothetical protein
VKAGDPRVATRSTARTALLVLVGFALGVVATVATTAASVTRHAPQRHLPADFPPGQEQPGAATPVISVTNGDRATSELARRVAALERAAAKPPSSGVGVVPFLTLDRGEFSDRRRVDAA